MVNYLSSKQNLRVRISLFANNKLNIKKFEIIISNGYLDIVS